MRVAVTMMRATILFLAIAILGGLLLVGPASTVSADGLWNPCSVLLQDPERWLAPCLSYIRNCGLGRYQC